MIRKFSISMLAASAAMLGGVANAAPLNVPGSFATVQAALDAAAPSGDEVIIAPGTYTGPIHVNGKSVTVRGSDPMNRPILAVQAQPTDPGIGFQSVGLLIRGDATTVDVSDVIIIPAATSTPGRGVQATTLTSGASIACNFTNILIAPNSGSDTPATTDPFDDATAFSGTNWTSDGMYLTNRAFLASLLDGLATYTLTDVTVIGAGRDGIIAYPSGPTSPGGGVGSSLVATGVKIARCARNAIQWGDSNLIGTDYTITGTKANPGLLSRNNNLTGAGAQDVTGINGARDIVVDHLVHIDHTGAAGSFFISVGNASSVSISDSLFAGNGTDGLSLTESTNAATVGVQRSTFFANGTVTGVTANIWFEGTTSTYTISDCIFAGVAGNDNGGLVYNASTGAQVTLANNALVTAGPNALASAQFGSGAPAGAESGTVSSDPVFSSTDTSSLAALQTSFNIGSPAYAGAGTAASDLTGWGILDVPPAAQDWALYE